MSDGGADGADGADAADEADQADVTPRPAQSAIIVSDDYPMRVLAGAGTGKTYTMVEKIERLLEDGTPPDEILALTFTNKAADSIREKLVETVGKRGYDVEAYTYHAVCHELLSEFAYRADVDPRFDVATEAEQLQLVYEVLDEVPYRFTNPDVYEDLEYVPGAPDRLFGFIESMKRAGITPDELAAYLPPPERLAELDETVDRIEAAVEEHLRTGKHLRPERLDAFDERFDEFVAVLDDEQARLGVEDRNETPMEQDVAAYLDAMRATIEGVSDLFYDNADQLDDGEFANAHKLAAHLFGSYSSAPKGMPPLAFTLPETLETFLEECKEISDLVPGYRAYQQQLRDANVLDFNDLVLETVALLEDETVAGWLADRYTYVFCDEFQDTDSLQFELVTNLVTDEKLFVVGDDDQAIYEWRGADVENIGPKLDAAYPTLTQYELQENFRSKQPILDLANDALSHLEGRGSDTVLEGTFEKADARDGVIHVKAAADLEEEAQQVRNAIARLVDGQTSHTDEPYDPGDIAVLVRKRKHARPIIEALASAGIPYDLAGDIATESVGVETVVAGLKAIADPADEVSINRLLTMRYRLSTGDLASLNTGDDSLRDALESVDPSRFDEPDRVERAASDLTALWERRDTYSLTRLYRALKDQLELEWFLSEQERRDLRQLDELIDGFDDGPVEPELTSEFIEFLDRHGTVTAQSSRGLEEQPEETAAGVRIMTIHKSKGLEFPVVVLPELVAEEWEPGERSYDRIEAALDPASPGPAHESPLETDLREARRVLHVAITRAEEWCVLFGRGPGEGDGDGDGDEDGAGDEDADRDPQTMRPETVDAALSDAVPWSVTGVSFPIWETIQDSLQPDAIDGTDTIATPIDRDERIAAVDGDATFDRREARARVLDLGRQALAGELDVAPSDRIDVPAVVREGEPAVRIQRRHSYTSLDALETCTRQHYLNYVVRAYDDPTLVGEGDGGSDTVSTRTKGIVFHEAAERAATRGYTTAEEWKRAARKIARTRGEEAAIPAVETCIDRYFDLPANEWEFLSAERDFEVEIDGELVVGQIDALCRTPDGDLVVLDYKATDHTREIDTDLQLPLYVFAARELFEEPVERAGYAYVGAAGPELDTRRFDAAGLDEALTRVSKRLGVATRSNYTEYTQGDHCPWCSHAGLPCGPDY